jgi:hypothetical protein
MPDSTFGTSQAFDSASATAEMQKQSAQAAIGRAYTGEFGPQVDSDKAALQKAANVAYFKAMLAAAVATGQSTSAAISALMELGVRP